MSHPPTEQGVPAEQGRSGRDDGTVALTEGGLQDEPRSAARVGHGGPAPSGWPPPTNTKAIIALCTVFSVPVLGIVFGVMARREIDRTGEGGRAYATWGLALGIAFCTLIALYVVVYLVFLAVIFASLGNVLTAGGGPGLGA